MDIYRGTPSIKATGYYQSPSRGTYAHLVQALFQLITNAPFDQVTKLCGPEPLTKYVVLGVVSLQITCACLLRNNSMLSWPFLATAYLVGATANQNLFLAIHEISHNLAFRSPMANRLLAIFANLPIGIPYSAAFRVCPACPDFSREFKRILTDTKTALPPNPPQIHRGNRSRHRPPNSPRSPLSRLPPRQSILLHIPNPLLRFTSNVHLQPPIHPHPPSKPSSPTLLRLHSCPSHRILPTTILPNYQLVPRGLPPSLRRPFHSRALLLLEREKRRHGIDP